MGYSYWRGAAYHSQQSVEKIIKGYLAHKQIRFPKTHDIEDLIDLVVEVDPALAKKLRSAKRPTQYAIEYRYPDAAKRPMTQAKARAATKMAARIYELVSAKLRE